MGVLLITMVAAESCIPALDYPITRVKGGGGSMYLGRCVPLSD